MNTKIKQALAVVAILAVMAGFALAANTTTYTASSTGTMAEVGGLPMCVTFTGTHGDDGALTVTLPTGFKPSWGWYVDNATDGDAPVLYTWTASMATGTAHYNGSITAFSMDAAVDLDGSTAGTFVIDADATTNGRKYYGVLCR